MYTFDHDLFLWLNFDGGKIMDSFMMAVSGTTMWLPLYAFILIFVLRHLGWKRTIAFVVCLALAIGLSDVICGIFKHQGLLKNLLPNFPVRFRPMHTEALQGLIHVPRGGHGHYGTVSAHAATVVSLAWFSALTIRRNWYNWVIAVSVILICYSRIYLACHFPMDLLLGAGVGTISGLSTFFLWKKLDILLQRATFAGEIERK